MQPNGCSNHLVTAASKSMKFHNILASMACLEHEQFKIKESDFKRAFIMFINACITFTNATSALS
jgi:hypothetical protein